MKPNLDWNNQKITYIINYDQEKDWVDLKKRLNIGKKEYPDVREKIIKLIKKYLYRFYKIGTHRTFIRS